MLVSIKIISCLFITGAAPAALGQNAVKPFSSVDTLRIKSIRNSALQSIDKGNPGQADSMLAIVDSAGLLDPYDMVRWIQVKGVLSMYNEAARLCCRVHGDSHLSSLARSRLVEQLADVDLPTRRDALAQYRSCVFSFKNADTLRLKLWLSSVYENFGMYTEADGLLFDLDSGRFPSAIQFLENAQRRFYQRLFSQSVTPAFAAYQRTADPALRSLVATILYQCYLLAGRSDSAAYWLSKASFTDPRYKAQAAAFLQEAGYFDKADSLISTLAGP